MIGFTLADLVLHRTFGPLRGGMLREEVVSHLGQPTRTGPGRRDPGPFAFAYGDLYLYFHEHNGQLEEMMIESRQGDAWLRSQASDQTKPLCDDVGVSDAIGVERLLRSLGVSFERHPNRQGSGESWLVQPAVFFYLDGSRIVQTQARFSGASSAHTT